MRSSVALRVGTALCVVLMHASSQATISTVHSGDAVNTSNVPVGVAVTVSGSGSVTAVTAAARPSNLGGTDRSARGIRVVSSAASDVASFSPDLSWAPAALSHDQAASFAMRIQSGPASASTFAHTLVFGHMGCEYRLVPDSGKYAIDVYYSNEYLYRAPERIATNYCSTDITLACTSSAECPQSGTCQSGYWAELELRQQASPSPVKLAKCELWLWGRPQHSEDWFTLQSGTQVVTDYYFVLGKPANAPVMSLDFDDVVFGVDAKVGSGQVAFLYPDANGTGPNTLSRNQCSGTTGQYWPCVEVWRDGGTPATTTNPSLRTENTKRTATIAFNEPPTALLGSVIAAQWSAMLRTSTGGSGSWGYTMRPQWCAGGSCQIGADVTGSVTQPTTETYVHRIYQDVLGLPWSRTKLLDFELQLYISSKAPNQFFHWKAAGLMYYMQRSEPLITNLRDHDVGENDGQVTLALIGDSLTGGTISVTCTNDENRPCSQDTYCSWDEPDGQTKFGDLPHGGCVSDTQCRTCVGRRADLNGGAGAQCSSDAECPQTGGTCNTTDGVCNQNENIPCSVDADCNGWGGQCDTTATCVDACPGGDCPKIGMSWAGVLCGLMPVDNCIQCGLGGERLYQMLYNRWDPIVTASGNPNDYACVAIRGAWAQPDYLLVYEGANDQVEFASYTPNCVGSRVTKNVPYIGYSGGLTGWASCYPWCSEAQHDFQCLTDSECQSQLGPSSRCIGATKTGIAATRGDLCIQDQADNFFLPLCSMRAGAECNADGDCPVSGMTCVDATGSRTDGFCGCASDAQCGSGWRCVGARCRRICTADSQCSSPTRAGSCRDTGAGYSVCAGRCTCSCDARTCTTDADCDLGTTESAITSSGGANPWAQLWRLKGLCVSGRCTQCGANFCRDDYPFAFQKTQKMLSPARYAKMVRWLHSDLASRQDGSPPDGLPILIMLEPPDWPRHGLSCVDDHGWIDNGYIRQGLRKAAASGVRVINTIRPAYEAYYQSGRGGLLHSDSVHNTLLGAQVIAQEVKKHLDRLNVCRSTTTDQTQKYCYSRTTQQYTSTTCVSASDCGGGAVECRNRPCASESDCPASGDSCVVE